MFDCRDGQVSIEVRCSKGTYIRTLAVDIGERLGCGAHLIALRRTVTGGMSVTSAITLEALQAMSEIEREAALLSADALIAQLPAFQLDAEVSAKVMQGRAFVASLDQSNSVSPAPTGELVDSRVRLYGGGGEFLGLGTLTDDGWCKPLRLVASN